MITKKQARRLRTLITQFENAAREDAFKGSQHPEDAAAIEHNYKLAKNKLQSFVRLITEF